MWKRLKFWRFQKLIGYKDHHISGRTGLMWRFVLLQPGRRLFGRHVHKWVSRQKNFLSFISEQMGKHGSFTWVTNFWNFWKWDREGGKLLFPSPLGVKSQPFWKLTPLVSFVAQTKCDHQLWMPSRNLLGSLYRLLVVDLSSCLTLNTLFINPNNPCLNSQGKSGVRTSCINFLKPFNNH